jgi:hypothetical protein
MIGSFYGIRTFNICSNPVPFRNMREVYYFGPKADKHMQAMGSKYLICDECSVEAVNRYKFREQIDGVRFCKFNFQNLTLFLRIIAARLLRILAITFFLSRP